MTERKIVAVASIGGHWIQLLRITRTLESEFDVSYVSTHEKCGVMVNGHPLRAGRGLQPVGCV